MNQAYLRVRLLSVSVALASIAAAVIDLREFAISIIASALEYGRVTLETAFSPAWECVGVVLVASKTLYGYATKSPYRLILYGR